MEFLRQYCSHSLFSPSTFSWEDVGTRLPLFCFKDERRLRMDPIKLAITDLNELILRRKEDKAPKKEDYYRKQISSSMDVLNVY